MVVLFWALRLIIGFAALLLLMFSWRASLTVAVCLFFDFFGIVVAAMPGNGLWNHARLMLGVGLFLGAATSIGRQRGEYWEMSALALPVSLLLSASWLQDRESLDNLLRVWPAYLASALAMPAGCLCMSAAFDLAKRYARSRARNAE